MRHFVRYLQTCMDIDIGQRFIDRDLIWLQASSSISVIVGRSVCLEAQFICYEVSLKYFLM